MVKYTFRFSVTSDLLGEEHFLTVRCQPPPPDVLHLRQPWDRGFSTAVERLLQFAARLLNRRVDVSLLHNIKIYSMWCDSGKKRRITHKQLATHLQAVGMDDKIDKIDKFERDRRKRIGY